MAATASFKQQCPSCEAWVPIRDPNLIGRKIDCPKCKYRFVVEDPGTEAEDEVEAETPAKKPGRGDGKGAVKGKGGPRRRDEDDEDGGKAARRKGSGGGSTKLILGVGLGVVAVGILVAVAIFIFMNNENTPKPSTSSPSAVATNQPPAAAPGEPAPEEGEKPAPAATAAAVAAALPASPEVLSNLMPNDTEGICNVRLKELTRTSLGRTIFSTPGSFRSEAIQQRLGLGVEEIDLFLQAWSFSQNWSFNVIHTNRPINQNAVKAALRARPAPEGKIEDQEYFVLEPNSWLDSLGNMTFAMLLQINPAQVPAHSGSRALRIYDDQTLVLADLAPMKQFLAFKGRFPPKPQPKEAAADAATAEGAEGTRPGGAIVPRGRGGPPTPEPGATEPENAPPAPSGSYLTVNPNLKSMLDLIERKQPVVSLAIDTQAARRRLPPLGLSALEALLDTGTITKLAVKSILEEAGVFGASVQLKDGLALTLAEDCQNEDLARRRYGTLRRETGPELAKVLTAVLGTPVEVEDEQNNPDNPLGGEQPVSPANIPGRNLAPPPGRPGVLGAGVTRPGAPGVPFGGPGSGMGPRGNTLQSPTDPEKPKPGSTIKVEGPDKSVVLLTISLIDQGVNSRLMNGKIRQVVLQQKGYLDMAGGRLRIFDLGEAARRYAEANQAQFPRGTVERPIPSTRAGRPYEPKQRISWMAELLPYLGPEQASLHRGIDRTKSWNDPENLGAAVTLIPQFLVPNYPQNTWWVRYPSMTEPVAATHYVGIAGIGADAAEYSANDPATAKKLGVFGYDRATRLQDITDGVSNTILMAQVPPTYKRPWMAGGGSTVQGVLEKDSVRPFVSPQPDGKRGSLVVMADGSVRFVAETIPDDVFKALCTIKGGETGLILDRDAPPVARPEGDTDTPPPPISGPGTSSAKAGVPGSTDQLAGWKEFSSKEGKFSVILPGTPIEGTQVYQSPIGPINVHMFTMPAANNAGVYIAAYADYPVQPDQKLDVDKGLDGTREGLLKNLPGAKLLGEKKISLEGNPGRELKVDVGGQGTARWRIVFVKQRQYQTAVMGSEQMTTSKEADQFLDSFKLLSN